MNSTGIKTALGAIILLFTAYAGFEILITSNSSQKIEAPIIEKISWGKIVVKNPDGSATEYKAPHDLRIYPQGHDIWDWKKTDTHHKPGIQILDLEDLVHKADIFILSRGMQLVLETKPETVDYLKKQNKQIYILESCEAAKLYNELVQKGKKVTALIHSTC